MKKPRLIYIDNLKGIACLLVLFAHFIPDYSANTYINYAQFLSGFVPSLFLALFGVTFAIQITYKPIKNIFINYILLFVFSFLLNGIITNNYLFFDSKNIVMMIAIFAGFSLFIYKILNPLIKVLNINLMMIASFLIYLIFKLVLTTNNFPVEGFNFLPWYSFFVFGIFINSLSLRKNFILSLLLWSVFTFFYSKGWAFYDHGEDTFKWFMSPTYFIYSLSCISSLFFLVKIIKQKNLFLINFFGQNTLLFWLIQYLVFFKTNFSNNSVVLYLITITLLIFVVMKVILFISKKPFLVESAKTKKMWAMLIILIIINSYLPSKISTNLSYILFACFSTLYKYFPIKKINIAEKC